MQTNHYLLVDRSGSMASLWKETTGAINAYIEKQNKEDLITIVAFDDSAYQFVRKDVRISDCKTISQDEVKPQGLTPLYDSVQRAATDLIERNSDRAVLMVITDGYENCSKCGKADVNHALNMLRKRDYEVLFIGANFNDTVDADSLGINKHKYRYMPAGTFLSNMQDIGIRTSAYSTAGAKVEL